MRNESMTTSRDQSSELTMRKESFLVADKREDCLTPRHGGWSDFGKSISHTLSSKSSAGLRCSHVCFPATGLDCPRGWTYSGDEDRHDVLPKGRFAHVG